MQMGKMRGWLIFITAIYVAELLFIPQTMKPVNATVLDLLSSGVSVAYNGNYSFGGNQSYPAANSGSIGTPIAGYEDLEPLFRAIRDVETAAFTDDNCGNAKGYKPTNTATQ